MKHMKILCGIAGAGKSTLARKIAREYEEKYFLGQSGQHSIILAADDFWDKQGKYTFNAAYLGIAHGYNKARAAHSCWLEIPLVIIDNTNLTAKERSGYEDVAKTFGYEVEYWAPNTPWAWDLDELFKRGTHGVPMETLIKMKARWSPPEGLQYG